MMIKKNEKKRFLRFVGLALVVFMMSSCHEKKTTVAAKRQVVETKFPLDYLNLYKAISIRDEKSILGFTKDSNSLVRNEAWRALFNTHIMDSSDFFKDVLADHSYPAWFALSGHAITKEHQEKLEDLWNENENYRAGISLVLGLQGDKQALKFLKNHLSRIGDPKNEYSVAMAMSRLLMRNLSERNVGDILLVRALNSKNQFVMQACLYGAYRSHVPLIDSTSAEKLIVAWRSHKSNWNRLTREMVIGIVFKSGNSHYTSLIETDSLPSINVNLGVEIARDLAFFPVNEKSLPLYIGLLKNRNPNVVLTCLKTLQSKKWSNALLANQISVVMDESKEKYPAIYVTGLEIMQRFKPGLILKEQGQLKKMAERHPYQAEDILQLLGKSIKQPSFIEYLNKEMRRPDMRLAMAAVNAGNNEWSSMSASEKGHWQKEYRKLYLTALSRNDYGLTAELYPFFMDTLLFKKHDFIRLKKTMSHFSFPADVEAYEALVPVLKTRFGSKGRHIVDSLAAMQFPAFNRRLKDYGWKSVPPVNYRKFPLLQPDWNRLKKLGRYPIWTLKTVKGIIKIRLNALRAPATVSAIDSLTRKGLYNGVPFHRVVPDFVIQGGDYERKDGYGGAGFVLPTEANEKEFIRGAVGIASAGTDTEGPQYFIMHQWAPHLNGHYTLFGQVIKGMDVVDRIMVGDKVIEASIEPGK